jgi:hypothetical protein
MRRPWAMGAVVLSSVFPAFAAGQRNQPSRPHLPPPLEARDCSATPPPYELPNARFVRKGGRTGSEKVSRQGAALTVDDLVQGRDLRRYERLELADVNLMRDRRGATLAQARSFLWGHWRDRRQGYLILTLTSVDAIGTSHVFVEEDETGRWRVYWRIVRGEGLVSDAPTSYSMSWVIPGDWDKPGTPLTEGQEPDALGHKLELRDVCGDMVDSL